MSIKQTTLSWSEAALEMLSVIPPLFKQDAKETMERSALAKGLSIVDVETVIETRDNIFNKLNIKPKDVMPKARDFLNWLVPRIMVQQGESPVYWLDIDKTLEKINDRNDWIKSWTEIASHFQSLGEEALAKEHFTTAKYAFLNSSLYYRWSHFPINSLTKEKTELMNKSIASYLSAMCFFNPPIERVSIKFEDKFIYGYFRPAPSRNSAPCIICVHGADSTKEELISHMQYAHERDLAVMIFDGPGQAEARLSGMTFELDKFTKSISCVIDYLAQRKDVMSDKIALWGVCLGGFLSLYASAKDQRIAACVSNGGAYNYDVLYDSMPNAWISAFGFITDSSDRDETLQKLKGKLTLAGVIEKIKCPVLLVHASGDQFIPLEQVHYIYEMLPGAVKFLLSEGGDHCSASYANIIWPKMFDWLADTLSGKYDPDKIIDKYVDKTSFTEQMGNLDNGDSFMATFNYPNFEFTPEAVDVVKQIPALLRKMAVRNIIKSADQKNVHLITKELILETRKKILGF